MNKNPAGKKNCWGDLPVRIFSLRIKVVFHAQARGNRKRITGHINYIGLILFFNFHSFMDEKEKFLNANQPAKLKDRLIRINFHITRCEGEISWLPATKTQLGINN